jgi:hypothetical protein
MSEITEAVKDLFYCLVISAFAIGVVYTAAKLVFHAWFTTKHEFKD